MIAATSRKPSSEREAAHRAQQSDATASSRPGSHRDLSGSARERRRAPGARAAFVGLAVAGLAIAGCGSDDAESQAASSTAETSATTAKAAKTPQPGSAKRSFERYFEEFRDTSFGLNVNGVRENGGGWIDVLWAGDGIEDVDFDLVQRMCGTISGWLVSTDEKWANTGYIELHDGTRLAKCTVGNQDLES
ncbi:MAG: hypothetical protein ITG02_10455 [Patulibacter sp.]|nr:hypothetical protein [Patulibacter sp.]